VCDRIAYSVADIQRLLGISKRSALAVANRIGIRVSPNRIIVPAVRLERWLAGDESPFPERGGEEAVNGA
jgi:hypothetical protein